MHKRTHNGIKSYKCDLCGKSFFSSGDLGQHKKYHDGIKPYECYLCEKAFVLKNELTKHNKSVGHVKRTESQKEVPNYTQIEFIDCVESEKLEDDKEETNEEENVDDPISIHQVAKNSYVC